MSTNIHLLIDGNKGIYVPNYFEKYYLNPDFTKFTFKGMSDEQLTENRAILQDTDHADYWEAWDDILNITLIDTAGNEWLLYQDGDLWCYRKDAQETEEVQALFGA